MTPPAVSVVIDNYNYARYLEESISSALSQTHGRVEVIVVDDGSTDDSRAVIQQYATSVSPVFKSNGGQASAFNAGFAASSGDVVIFLDADDVLEPNAAAEAAAAFADPNVVKVQWSMLVVDAAGAPLGRVFPEGVLAEGDLLDAVVSSGPTNQLSAPGGGSAWSRGVLERLLPIPESLYRNGGDTYLFEVAPFFGHIRVIDRALSRYRQHAGGDHLAFTVREKVDRELRFYRHYSEVAHRRCLELGRTADRDAWNRNNWWARHAQLLDDLSSLPAGQPLVLIDDGCLELGELAAPRRLSFSRDGQSFAGAPADDAEALSTLDALMTHHGVRYLAVAWGSSWWLEHYAAFAEHLEGHYGRVVDTDSVIVFELTVGAA